MAIIKIEGKGKVSLVTLTLKLLSGHLQTPRIPNISTKIEQKSSFFSGEKKKQHELFTAPFYFFY